ncbi:MAG: restriction endonuclease [Candidatus Thorarchaeota archaeon]
MAGKAAKPTLREWLAQHGRNEPIHYKEIAEALERDPASVSASLSIEWKQAQEDNRPAYFVRTGPGLYQYNDLCEGAVDEELISEVSARADDFNRATRREMRLEISKLDIEGFNDLAKIVLLNVRARVEEAEEVQRYNGNVVLVTSWRDDGGRSPVVVYAKKCRMDEKIGVDLIREIRGTLPNYQANQGVLITNGIVSDEGKQEALGYREKNLKVSVPPVHIMDIEIILNVLLESRTGVRAKRVEVLLLDIDFFKRLRHST